MDIEVIQLCEEKHLEPGKFSKHHCFKRRTALRTFSGAELVLDGNPCIPEERLRGRDRESFQHCKKNLHGLDFMPPRPYFECHQIVERIWRFLEKHNIEIVFYKGGTIEKDVCWEIGIPCENLEHYGISKYPEKIHEPLDEIRYFYHQMVWKRDFW